jgi:transposase-like protein
MYSTEQRKLAIETFIRFGHSYADTIAELGYPDRHTLNSWWREYRETGEVPVGKMIREPKLSDDQKREAAGHCLGHGKSLSRTIRALGYPKGSDTLRGWIDELAPGQRKHRGPNPKRDPVPIEKKVQVVAEPEARTGPAAEIAEKHGVSRTAPYIWRREIMGDNVGEPGTEGEPVSRECDDLPDGIEVLQDMLRETKMQLRKVQLGPGVRQATLEIVKKDQGADPELLTNEEKAAMVEALRAECRLCEIRELREEERHIHHQCRVQQVGHRLRGRQARGGDRRPIAHHGRLVEFGGPSRRLEESLMLGKSGR